MLEEKVAEQITTIDDLVSGMKVAGKVTGTELYGAFVDIGVEHNGMIHISRLSRQRVNKVTDKVNIGDEVAVWIVDVDPQAHRIGLTMVAPPDVSWDELADGQILTGKVVRMEKYGAFVDIGAERPGLLHVREMGKGYIRHPSDIVKDGEEIEVRIVKVDPQKRQIDLTMNLNMSIRELREEEEEEEPFLSPMEIAFRDAQKGTQRRKRPNDHRKIKRNQRELEDIFQRTLNQR
ncbi:MAG TPA: S1 RNA-binding domain-containing protein [Thermoflexia bacterium]|nr:S1 RNA-binding domain-containing protein [Thermoflexia bacterium]